MIDLNEFELLLIHIKVKTKGIVKNMNKNNMKLKANVMLLISTVENNVEEQNKIIKILENYEAKIPDGKFKDFVQKRLRKNKNYYDKADLILTDIFEENLTKNEIQIIKCMMVEIKNVIDENSKSWWDQIMEYFDNATK